ncbi:Serine/threonine-protein kinase RIM15 [Apiospora arundinis]
MPRPIGRNELRDLGFELDANNRPTEAYASYYGVNDPEGVPRTRSRAAARHAPDAFPLPRPDEFHPPPPPRPASGGFGLSLPQVPRFPPSLPPGGAALLFPRIPAPGPNGLIPPSNPWAGVRIDGPMSEGVATGAEDDPRFLYSNGFATCTGVAISGTFPSPNPDNPDMRRYDRFLIHMLEEFWEEEFTEVRAHLVLAKYKGLEDLQIHVLAMQPEDQFYQDPVQQIREINATYKAQRDLMRALRRLLGVKDPNAGDHDPRIHWYPYIWNECYDAEIALFADRTFLANHRYGDDERWALTEVRWDNWPVAPVPRGTPWRPNPN